MLKRYIFCQKTLALKRGLDIGESSQLKYNRAVVVVIAKGKLHGKGIGGIILVWRSEEDAAVLIITEIMIRIVEVRTYSLICFKIDQRVLLIIIQRVSLTIAGQRITVGDL